MPALIIIALGINPMRALILSQVTLSFALPLAIIPMLMITKRKDLMGSLVNKPITNCDRLHNYDHNNKPKCSIIVSNLYW